MKVYYAHCLAIYDTPQEQRDVDVLFALGFGVVLPNTAAVETRCSDIRRRWGLTRVEPRNYWDSEVEHYQDPTTAVMELVFKTMVGEADALVFRALPDGRIPAGVAQEIQWAKNARKPVFELPSGIQRRTVSVAETREYLREVGQR